MLFLRSLLFYILLGLSTIVLLAPLLLLCLVLPGTTRNRVIAQWSNGIVVTLRVVCGVRHEVVGMENIPAENGIILCKHQSAWETFALQMFFPAQVWVLKRELLWIPIFGWGLKVVGAIAIDRKGGKKALMQVIKQGTERLKRGLWVVIFPEGTRSLPGTKGKYSIGGAMLASRSGFPVVPVAHNAGEFWGSKNFTIKPGTVKVVIGPVIQSEGLKAGEINDLSEQWIEEKMALITDTNQSVAGVKAPKVKKD